MDWITLMDCGCRVKHNNSDIPSVLIIYCPKHKAALDMYEALKSFNASWLNGDIEMEYKTRNLVGKALAKAEGK